MCPSEESVNGGWMDQVRRIARQLRAIWIKVIITGTSGGEICDSGSPPAGAHSRRNGRGMSSAGLTTTFVFDGPVRVEEG